MTNDQFKTCSLSSIAKGHIVMFNMFFLNKRKRGANNKKIIWGVSSQRLNFKVNVKYIYSEYLKYKHPKSEQCQNWDTLSVQISDVKAAWLCSKSKENQQFDLVFSEQSPGVFFITNYWRGHIYNHFHGRSGVQFIENLAN